MKAIIIGAGIGGLCAGIGLKQVGVNVSIYEQSDEPRAAGAGLTLWANAVHALNRLNLGDSVQSHALEVKSAIRRADGRVLSALDPDKAQARFGAPVLAVHRVDLMRTLLDHLGDAVHYGKRFDHYETHGDQVSAVFTAGATVTGDLLIGADGIGSAVRQQMHPHATPVYRGYPAWRAVLDYDHARANHTWGESWGRGARFGTVPLSEGRIYWFATANRPANSPPTDHRQTLESLFNEWHRPIPDLIAATPDDAILYNDIADIDPLATWIDGRAVLLGDAAHAMTPNMGQGACQAIEDAAALTDAIRHETTLDAALTRYERQRLGHTSRIVLQSRRIGQLGQVRHPVMVALRNRTTRLMPEGVSLRALDFVMAPPG